MANGKFNEGKACDAVIRRLEAREGKLREDVRFPERERHSAPVEIVCKIGETQVAFEHTGIEPFAGHVQMQAQAEERLGPIKTMLDGKLPPDVIELMIPVLATQRISARDLPPIQRALAAWVEEKAPTLPVAPYARYKTTLAKVRPPGVPFPVSLFRFDRMGFPPRFQITHLAGDLDRPRESRIRTACAKKFPKLEAWKKAGARTVLVFEDNDIQLTNPQVVYEALAKVEKEFITRPDEVYLVGSWADPWFIQALRIDDRNYYELSDAGACMSEVDPATLVDLTGR
jgi:hypothetical protein